MSIENLLASNAAYAVSVFKQYVLNPVVVCPNGVSVPLKLRRYRCFGDSIVSKRVIIDLTQGKKTTTDNVAPGPHQWQIEAYVGGLPFEISSRFMPSIGMMREALDGAWQGRQQVAFFDKYQKQWQVVVEHFEYEPAPDEENAILVRLDLVELNVQTVSASGVVTDNVSAAATPADGTAAGAPKNLGATESNVQSSTSSTAVSVDAIPGTVLQ